MINILQIEHILYFDTLIVHIYKQKKEIYKI